MTHVDAPDGRELMDVLEGTAAGPRARTSRPARPAASAARTRRARAWPWRASADVPEPSPLYWDAFRRQVGRRSAEEPPARGLAPVASRPWLAPAAAAVALLWRWSSRRERAAGAVAAPALPAWSALPPREDDAGLDVLEVWPRRRRPRGRCRVRGVADCLIGLSDEESLDLADALRASWRRARSVKRRWCWRLIGAAVLACGGAGPASGGAGAPGAGPRDDAFRMVDAYIVSNLQESLGLTDEQFVKALPLVKRLQRDRRELAQRRAGPCARCAAAAVGSGHRGARWWSGCAR